MKPVVLARSGLQVVVHCMATMLGVRGIQGLLLTPPNPHLSPEDQSHLRVFWSVPIIMSSGIHYGLYSLFLRNYGSNSNEAVVAMKRQARGLLKAIGTWMGTAACVRVLAIGCGDPTPRMVPIVVELLFAPFLWFLSEQ